MCQKLNKENARIANVNKVAGGRWPLEGRQRWSAALQGALATEGSLFRYKSLQTPYFAQKKKEKKEKEF